MTAVINQMGSYSDPITNQTIVPKVLCSLRPQFDHVVAAIEELKDLTTVTIDELRGFLQAHEARLNRLAEKIKSKAF